jgi:ribosomal subunit interface protein
MNIQLTFRGFPPSEAVRHHVEDRAAKLLGHDDAVISLRVALEAPHHHHHHGHAYRVRIEVMVPGADIVISPRDGAQGHTDLHAAIDDAFIAAGRRLREHARIRRGIVKSHEQTGRAARSA